MNTNSSVLSIKNWIKEIDWKLLVFLLLFLNVKLVIKVAAILIIYLIQPNFKFSFHWKESRLPLFYPAVCLIALLDLLISISFTSVHYDIAFLVGLAHWLLCILAIHQTKLFVDKNNSQVIYHTIILFFLINAAASLLIIGKIVLETGALNPYRYQGQFQKYFINTGDYIKGITFDTSTTNAALNAFGIVFFLFKRNMIMVLLCMTIFLLTASNLVNVILFVTLIGLFIFNADKNQKSVIVACFLLAAVFLVKVSPQNVQYVLEKIENITNTRIEAAHSPIKEIPVTEKPDSILNQEQRKEKIALLYLDSIRKIKYQAYEALKQENKPTVAFASYINSRPEIPEPSIHTAPFQHRDDTDATRKEVIQFISYHKENNETAANLPTQISQPGKIIAFKQTLQFLYHHPQKIISGAGIGNFSSKLAFRTTALHFAGGYPKSIAYIHPDFSSNHLNLFLLFFSQTASEHSITNSPNAVYDQLLSEYGLFGITAFLVFYLGFFFKDYRKLTYGVPLLFLLLGLFFIDYWFEQLSIVILFELLLILNKKEASTKEV